MVASASARIGCTVEATAPTRSRRACRPRSRSALAAAATGQGAAFRVLKKAGVRQVAYVPDAGHAHTIREAQDDPEIRDIVLTSEEEGVAVACGAWLGGDRAVLLMQSSGVGNCVNL